LSNVTVGRPRGFDEREVLDKAMAVFWRLGFEGAGLADLERATGLGRQSLYGAFGDKRALFSRVVDHYFECVLKPAFIDVLDAPGSARQNLERVFALWESTAEAPDFNGCLIGNGVSELGLRDVDLARVLAQKLELLEAAFVRSLARARRAGEVKATLPVRATARSLLATAQGLAVVARVRRDRAFVRSIVDQSRRLLDA
jgi:TetR/AcrR family transcriptional regulator, transcriptional repressor for nem operon